VEPPLEVDEGTIEHEVKSKGSASSVGGSGYYLVPNKKAVKHGRYELHFMALCAQLM
jgi:hypothetical protein